MTRTIQRLCDLSAGSALAGEGITIAQWQYLEALSQHGSLGQSELSTKIGLAPTTIASAIAGLARRGLVRRLRRGHDQRRSFVSLSEQGRAVVERCAPLVAHVLEDAKEGIPPRELAVFWSVLDRIARNLTGGPSPDIHPLERLENPWSHPL